MKRLIEGSGSRPSTLAGLALQCVSEPAIVGAGGVLDGGVITNGCIKGYGPLFLSMMPALGRRWSRSVLTKMPGKTRPPRKVSHEPNNDDPHPVNAEPRGYDHRDQGNEHRSEVFPPGGHRYRPAEEQP